MVKNKTIQALKIVRIDPKQNLIYVKGHVPGVQGNFVRIRDAFMKQFVNPQYTPPFPMYQVNENDNDDIIDYIPENEDPFAVFLE